MLVVADVVKKSPAFNEKWRSITVVTTARDWSILSASGIQSACSNTVSLKIILDALVQDARSSHKCRRIRLSIYPHVSTRLPLDGFLWNLITRNSMKIRRGNGNLVKIGQKYRATYLRTLVCSYCWEQYVHTVDSSTFILLTAVRSYCWQQYVHTVDSSTFILLTAVRSYCRQQYVHTVDSSTFILSTAVRSCCR